MIQFQSTLQKIITFLKQPKIQRIAVALTYLVIVFSFILIIILTIFSSGRPFSNRLFAITSGSMRPRIPMGSLVVAKTQNSYHVDDIVVFQNDRRLVTHRILSKLPSGQLQTKGDANSTPDRLPIVRDQIIGRVVLIIPRLGRLLMLLKTKVGIILLVVIPGATLIWQEILLAYKHMTYKAYMSYKSY